WTPLPPSLPDQACRASTKPRRAAGTQRLWVVPGEAGRETWRPPERRAAETARVCRAGEGGLGTRAGSAASLGHGAAQ
ncbi:hypothetical protein P7K49_025234, partial [Saguinus oedipus]